MPDDLVSKRQPLRVLQPAAIPQPPQVLGVAPYADERQDCSALIDLPVVLVMRTKFGSYPEYHTSLDDLSVLSPAGLEGAYIILQSCLQALEANYVYRATIPCEPQLGRRGIKPTLSTKNVVVPRTLMNVLAYADGQTDLLAISEIIGVDVMECAAAILLSPQWQCLKGYSTQAHCLSSKCSPISHRRSSASLYSGIVCLVASCCPNLLQGGSLQTRNQFTPAKKIQP